MLGCCQDPRKEDCQGILQKALSTALHYCALSFLKTPAGKTKIGERDADAFESAESTPISTWTQSKDEEEETSETLSSGSSPASASKANQHDADKQAGSGPALCLVNHTTNKIPQVASVVLNSASLRTKIHLRKRPRRLGRSGLKVRFHQPAFSQC